ncbi:MAG: RCC1 domain-containing protein [Bdellovibrionales bacterium]
MNSPRSNFYSQLLFLGITFFLTGCLESSDLNIDSQKNYAPQGLSLTSENVLQGGISKITLTLNYVTPRDVVVHLKTTPIDAVESYDYNPIDQDVTIHAGQSEISLPLITFKQAQIPGDHKVSVAVTSISGAQINSGESTLTIQEPTFSSVFKGVKLVNVSSGNVCITMTNNLSYCWGQNSSGQSSGDGSVSTGNSPILKTVLGLASDPSPIKLSGADTSICALYADGRVLCWGNDFYKNISWFDMFQVSVHEAIQSILGTGVTAIDVAAASRHTCVILPTGVVRCKGNGLEGELGDGLGTNSTTLVTVSGLPSAAVSVSANYSGACTLLATGAVYCWGQNANGEVGNGNIGTMYKSATATSLVSGVTKISSGGFHNCALKSDGTVFCWGSNTYGQLGLPLTTAMTSTPTLVTLPSAATALSLSARTSCALLTTGDVYCWGRNNYGQLGDGTTVDRLTPAKVLLKDKALQISLGDNTGCAILQTDNKLNCWGSNANNESRGTVESLRYATDMLGIVGKAVKDTGITTLIQGVYNSPQYGCAVLLTGETQCWGDNQLSELGQGLAPSFNQLIANVTGLGAGTSADVHLGIYTGCSLLQNTGVFCWGNNSQGQIGNGGVVNVSSNMDPGATPTGLSTGVAELSVFYNTFCARMSDQTVKCWGQSDKGQAGACTNQNIPNLITGITNAASVTAGAYHSCAVTSTGQLKCWGYGGDGVLGGGASATCQTTPVLINIEPVKKVAIGFKHICALTVAGGVQCWGDNSQGQLGVNGLASTSTPVQVTGLSSAVIDISLGGYHSCALLKDGSVRCWGIDAYDELGLNSIHSNTIFEPTQVSGLGIGVQKLHAGISNTCAITEGGFAKCWGANGGGIRDRGFSVQPYPGDVFDFQVGF